MARKPSALAQRRERDHADLAQASVGDTTLSCPMPANIEANPKLRELWIDTVGTGKTFNPEDASLIIQLVTNYAMLDDVNRQLFNEDGTTNFTIDEETAWGGIKTVKNPAFEIRDRLINESIKLCNALNLSPDARLRAGLTQSQTNAINVSIADTIYKALREDV